MSKKSSGSSGGIGFLGMLTILFIALKLLGKIDWSWWWVLAPVWGPAALVVTIILVCWLIMLGGWSTRRKPRVRGNPNGGIKP